MGKAVALVPLPRERRAEALLELRPPRRPTPHGGRGGCAPPRHLATTGAEGALRPGKPQPPTDFGRARPKGDAPRVAPSAHHLDTPPLPSAAPQARKAPPRRVVPCRPPACSVLPSVHRGAMVSQRCPHRPGKLPLLKGAQAAAALWYVGGAACQHTPSALAASRPRRCMRARLAPICLSN